MNLHFTFSIREISEIRDADQVLKIPMYFTVSWEVFWLVIEYFIFIELYSSRKTDL